MIKTLSKKALGVLAIGLAGLILVACGNETDSSASNLEGQETIHVGILQFMEHVSLTKAKNGFIEELEEAGINVEFEEMNAQGDQSNLQSMSEQLTGNNDLILAIATPAAQSIALAEEEKPVLFTAVTDPVDAGLVESMEIPGRNLTGTSDMVPIEEQTSLLLSLIDNPQTIGIAYNSSEPNSKIQAELAVAELEAAGVEVIVATVTTSNDVQTTVTSLAQDVDGIYLPTDNTMAATMPTIGEIATEYQLPIVAGATGMVDDGGLATYGINYTDLGRQTARIALRILQDDEEASQIAVETSDNLELVINEEMAEALGIDPESITMD